MAEKTLPVSLAWPDRFERLAWQFQSSTFWPGFWQRLCFSFPFVVWC